MENRTKLRILYLYQHLVQHTDAEHTLSTVELMKILKEDYSVKVSRNTISDDLAMLHDCGLHIEHYESTQNKYYYDGHIYELPELKVLVDAISSSKFITQRKSDELIAKLLTLTNSQNASKLRRHIYVAGRAKSDNENGYYIVDAINDAIDTKRKISFRYTDFDVAKQRYIANGGKPYTVSPYTLIWDGDYYYMRGFCDERQEMRNFRLDRLGEGYTVEDIKRRIQEQQRAILEGRVSSYQPLPARRYRFSGSWKTVRKKKITGFYALYLRYVYLLRRYKRPTRKRISYEMRREVLRLERYQAQFLYLHEHDISTLEQLMERQAQIEQEIQQRTELRQPLYTKRRYETDEKIKEELAREIDRQTTSLRQLRKERALCKRIEQQVPGIQQNLREFEENKSQNQKEAVRHEYQRRNR